MAQEIEALRITVDADQPVKILDQFGRALSQDIPKAADKADKRIQTLEKRLKRKGDTLTRLKKEVDSYRSKVDSLTKKINMLTGATNGFNNSTGKTPLIVRGARRSLILLASEVVGVTAAFRAFTSVISTGSEFERSMNRLRVLGNIDANQQGAQFEQLKGTIRS